MIGPVSSRLKGKKQNQLPRSSACFGLNTNQPWFMSTVGKKEEEEDERGEKIFPATMKGPLIQSVHPAAIKPTAGITMKSPSQQLPPWLQSNPHPSHSSQSLVIPGAQRVPSHLLFPNQLPSKVSSAEVQGPSSRLSQGSIPAAGELPSRWSSEKLWAVAPVPHFPKPRSLSQPCLIRLKTFSPSLSSPFPSCSSLRKSILTKTTTTKASAGHC